MEFHQLSDEAKILFVIWVNARRYNRLSTLALAWFRSTGKSLEQYEAFNQAADELRGFLDHCEGLRIAALSQRQKDRERTRRLTT